MGGRRGGVLFVGFGGTIKKTKWSLLSSITWIFLIMPCFFLVDEVTNGWGVSSLWS